MGDYKTTVIEVKKKTESTSQLNQWTRLSYAEMEGPLAQTVDKRELRSNQGRRQRFDDLCVDGMDGVGEWKD